MSLSNIKDKQTYSGDGNTTDFAIPFDIIADDSTEVDVYIRDESDSSSITETLQTEGAMQDYTLTGASPPTTPFHTTVSFNSAPAATSKIIIKRNLARTQTLSISESGDIPAESLEKALDRVVAQVQSLKEELDRIPKLRVSEQFGDTTLGQSFAERLIRVNSDNNGFEFVTPSTIVSEASASGLSGELKSNILDNQTDTAVSNFTTLDNTVHTSAILFGEVTRGSTGGHLLLSIRYINSAWVVKEILQNTDTAHGLTWSMNGGDLEYSSGAEGAGELKYNLMRFTAT